jgi:KDO2-lipid IV(A) lauroyltransferase
MALRMGAAGGRLARWLLRAHARRAGDQLARIPIATRPSVAEVFVHLGTCAAEVCQMPTEAAGFEDLVEVEGLDLIRERMAADQGTVWVSGHVGNWELPPAWAAAQGAEVHALVAPIHYPALDAWVKALRARHGVLPLSGGRHGLREAVQILRGGGHVALLVDQQLRGRGAWIPFLGAPAWTTTAAARLARRAGVPVGIVRCARAGGRMRIRFGPLLQPPIDPERVTLQISEAIEVAVLEHPEQWVWMHDRWGIPA